MGEFKTAIDITGEKYGRHNIGKCATCKHENASTFLPEDCKMHRDDNWEWKYVGFYKPGGDLKCRKTRAGKSRQT